MTKEEKLHWLDVEIQTWENDCQSKHPIKEALYAARKALEQESGIRNCSGCKYAKDGHNAGTEECHLCMWENQYTPATKNDLVHNLCNSCTNISCEFQSGIVRTECAFYMPPHIEPDNCGNYIVQEPTTKNDLEVDCISRQAVLDLIEHYNSDGLGSVFYGYEEGVKFANAVNKLPSVNSQEPSWIPVTERLPEESDNYLVTNDDGDVELAYFAHPKDYAISKGEWREIWYEDDIIAWMPLPKPYKEVEK